MTMRSVNPADETVHGTYEAPSDAELDAALDRSVDAHHALRAAGVRARVASMGEAARVIERRRDELAAIMTEEMGKTLASAKAEADKCALACRYYAEHGEAFLADEPVTIDEGSAYVAHLPLGPILAVMPWNFPFWQVVRFAAPALVAGNTGLLKHASNVPRCALALESVFEEAGFPEGAFQALLIGSKRVEGVLRDDRVKGATLTGSGPAGSAVARTAGDEIKPSVMELGGSDAYLVMPSADLDVAVAAAVQGRTQNNGQSCIAAKRFLVHADVYDAFKQRFVAAMAALEVGDPKAEGTDIGPLSLPGTRDDADDLVQDAIRAGAKRLTGAEIIEGPCGGKGYWYRPGILEGVTPDARAYKEELFGPVALLFRVPSLDAGIELANATDFGLGSAIFTQDEGEMQTAVRGLEAGATAINRIVASDPRLPFGGVKTSGYGRELARDGMMAFVNRKTVTRL
ncbi:NAD-dependent succinate-semialdehyde dehydrogenase [Parvularcula dongshanensis]|uniref:Succinate-semialdehyde dehydrogenase/glutarate-semialdehyde dehydrogenase n=1 Tax=Parvularcula dongshanensis TaxID=1173995 RepID=A0A840I5K5_9PROT|nr:NAD-dependent succinate-semialdehyde dehydrogenase [Parvularcula dongshanensis]MBB4659438.1 succinate-semialdehyde dehydrogenase/glutarate-semialdehyde dehydrogenase [Parvularcula dongshanensis]